MKKINLLLKGSAIAVAGFTVLFVILLIFTFNMDTWNGIESYAAIFQPSFLYTVYPSIFLALSFIVFNVSVFYYAEAEKKIWAHLAMNFGIVYVGIALTNYFIQLISVMPSIISGNLAGLDIWVSGYPNSIFFALMACYFLMCISYFFTAFVFWDKRIRYFLLLGSAGCILLFVLGALTGIKAILLLGALCWIVGTVVGTIMIAVSVGK